MPTKKPDPSPRAKNRPRVLVRCLGPGDEHHFLSLDPTRERICLDCRLVIRNLRLGELYKGEPVRVGAGN
jgi:hypothetical protein